MVVDELTPTRPTRLASSRLSGLHDEHQAFDHDVSLRPGPNPEVWVMTPGRADVFAFLMRGSSGFIFPWPRPQARGLQLARPAQSPNTADSSPRSPLEL
ncbi:MAG: hypothetical protein AAFV36_05895, partial [Myxococcota bacterium]